MTQPVKLGEVAAVPKGSTLVLNASGGATTLTIDYAGDFNASGGTLILNGVSMAYTSVTEGAAQYDPDVINLTGTLANAASIGDWVGIVDGGQEAIDYVAVCSTDGGDQIDVPLSYEQLLVYPVGFYDPAVPILVSDDLQRVEDAPGRTPTINGEVIEPGTVPSDGTPPASSPTPTVQGGIGSLFVKWTPISNYDPVTYEVHLGTTSGFGPSGATLVAQTPGSTIVLRKTAAGADLAYGTTYYVRLLAKDEDGAATAGYSTQGSGSMVQANTPDIATNAITANEINANAVTTAKIDAGAVTATQLAANSVTASKILAGEVTATKLSSDAIDGKTITGALLRTAATGERMEFQVTGPFNPAGQMTFYTSNTHEDPARPNAVFANDVGNASYVRLQAAGMRDSVGFPVVASGPTLTLQSNWISAGVTSTTAQFVVDQLSTTEDFQVIGVSNLTDVIVSGAFDAPLMFKSGVVNSPSGTANVVRTINVSFTTPFAVTPCVTANINVAATAARVRCWLGAVSTTGCTIYALREDNSGSYDVHWQATAPTQ